MKRPVDLAEVLDLERLDANLFRGHSPPSNWTRVYGGQVVGQALVAASRTVSDRPAHSLHGYFLLPGDPEAPIIYEVETLRNGRSFSARRVLAIQDGRPIFASIASFQVEAEGDFVHGTPMPDVPGPEDLPAMDAVHADTDVLSDTIRQYARRARLAELRPVRLRREAMREPTSRATHVWLRAPSRLSDDPDLHRSALAYLSDHTLLDAVAAPHGRSLYESTIRAASLDHAIWFHRPFRADEWLLYAQDAPSASGGRGLARGQFFSRDGRLVASTIQEGVLRARRPSPS